VFSYFLLIYFFAKIQKNLNHDYFKIKKIIKIEKKNLINLENLIEIKVQTY